MPQIFQVLRCYKCLIFQVHQTKKLNKFECKLCGEKQSIKRHYELGTAKECRHYVQRLNAIRGEKDEEILKDQTNTSSSDEEIENKKNNFENTRPIKSKWSAFVEETEEVSATTSNETTYLNDTEVVLEVPKKRFKGKFKPPCIASKVSSVNYELQAEKSDYTSRDTRNHSGETSSFRPSKYDNSTGSCRSGNTTSNMEKTTEEKSLNTQKKQLKKFVPPPINKNSNWAQFAEPSTSNTIVQNPSDLFTLCTDDDLDNVLFLY